tara:strand:- start:9130 stop:9978 length:849 start_codon:yes stop_codon:yes gene_type:complete
MNLVTVCGHNTTMLYHMIKHYEPIVDNFFVIIYSHHRYDPVIEKARYILDKFNLKPFKIVEEKPFDWERVTHYYNETTSLKPDDWWIISDDDELQIYSKPITDIVDECEELGNEFVTGGFVDRIGKNGEFVDIDIDCNVWKEMPVGGFFRYPLSKAEANKVTLLKGKHNVVSGQHFIQFDDGSTSWGKSHPLRYPVENNFTQVHHFKWDITVKKRLQEVSESKSRKSFFKEYQMMLSSLEYLNFKFDLNDRQYYFQSLGESQYDEYRYWKHLIKKILNIRGL